MWSGRSPARLCGATRLARVAVDKLMVPVSDLEKRQGVCQEQVALVLDVLREQKALDPVSLEGLSAWMPSRVVIASGTSARHVAALAEHVRRALRKSGVRPGSIALDGLREANWAVLSVRDVCVHIFRPEVRAYYDLESLYSRRASSE